MSKLGNSGLVKVKLTALLLTFLGVAIFTALLVREGAMQVLTAITAAGWGLAAVVLFHAVPLVLDAIGWRILFAKGERPPVGRLTWIRWMGESINNLLPTAQVGGDIMRVRLASATGVDGPVAAASVLVNITLNVLTQIVFTLGGFALVIGVTGRTALIKPVLAGALLSAAAIGGFFVVQRGGGPRWIGAAMAKMTGNQFQALSRGAEALDRQIKEFYKRTSNLAACSFWALVSWAVGAGEIWIALRCMGMDANVMQALIFESVSQGFRTMVFFIPGGLGAQEGGYLFAGSLLGIPGHAAMALALIRRVRELVVGLPGIIAWQVFEWKRLRLTAQEKTSNGGNNRGEGFLQKSV